MYGHNDQCVCVECTTERQGSVQVGQLVMPQMGPIEVHGAIVVGAVDQLVVTESYIEPKVTVGGDNTFPPPTLGQAIALLAGQPLSTRDRLVAARQLAGVRAAGELAIPIEVHGAVVVGAVDLAIPAGGRIVALAVRGHSGDFAIWWDRDRGEMVARPLVAGWPGGRVV